MSSQLKKIAIRWTPGLVLAATALAAATAPGAVVFPQESAVSATFPASRALNDVADWLQRDTPLTPSQVVDISPQAVTAVTSAQPMGETRGFLANISSEALDPGMLNHDGIASWSIPVEVNCDKGQVRLGVMTGYKSRDLRTDGRVVREADTAWVVPTATAPLGSVIKALCDRDFHRPLMGKVKATVAKAEKPVAIAKAAPPPAAPRPALRGPVTPPVEAPKMKAPAAPASPATGGVAVQIGASPSLADIQGLLARFKRKFAGPLGGHGTTVATVQVDGKTVNRALVTGFASNAEANAFCKTLSAAGQARFIRR